MDSYKRRLKLKQDTTICSLCGNKNRRKLYYQNMTEEQKQKDHMMRKKAWADKDPEKRLNQIKNIHAGGKSWWESLSDEEKAAHNGKLKDDYSKYYNGLSDDQKAERLKKIAKSTKEYWNNISDDKMEEYKQKQKDIWNNLSEQDRFNQLSGLRNYWANASDEDLEMISQKKKDWWSSLAPDIKQSRIDKLSEFNRNLWESYSEDEREYRCKLVKDGIDNMSAEDKASFAKIVGARRKMLWDVMTDDERTSFCNKLSDAQRNHWKNITPEKFEEWNKSRQIGYNSYLNNLGFIPNKNEASFINDLKIYSIPFEYQYYNKTKHKDFDKLFPENPITGSALIDYMHAWDFKINTLNKSILIDIDGSIHEYSSTSYPVTDYRGNKVILSDLIKFNDSQRPYQTDGLDAYVIQCYDNKLTNDTKVLCLNTNEIITYKDFINILIYLNTEKKEG